MDGNKTARALSLGETPQRPEDDRDGSFCLTLCRAMAEFGVKASNGHHVVLRFISASQAGEELLKSHPELVQTLANIDEVNNTISLRPAGGSEVESARRSAALHE